jgi:hypothetical protein
MNAKPDFVERKRKEFIHDQDGTVRLVITEEESATFLDDDVIEESHRTELQWLCESCGEFVSSFVKLRGERLGIQCDCARRWAKKIRSDEFWEPSSQDRRDVEKAEMLLKILLGRERRGLLARIRESLHF